MQPGATSEVMRLISTWRWLFGLVTIKHNKVSATERLMLRWTIDRLWVVFLFLYRSVKKGSTRRFWVRSSTQLWSTSTSSSLQKTALTTSPGTWPATPRGSDSLPSSVLNIQQLSLSYFYKIHWQSVHQEQSEFHYLAHRITHQTIDQSCQPLEAYLRVDLTALSSSLFLASCATCWTVWVWLQRTWWSEQASSSTAVTSTVIRSGRMTGESFCYPYRENHLGQTLASASLWLSCPKREILTRGGYF